MERIWLDHYPDGVPADITDQAQRYDSLVALFEESCKLYAERVAYVSMGSTMTYAQLDQRSRDFAAWLQTIGVQKGDRVALMMPNMLQYPVCLFGTMRAGAVVVNTNPLYTADELTHQLKGSGAQTIVIAENFAHTLQKSLPHTDIKSIVLTSLGEMLGTAKGMATDFVVRHIKKLIPPYTLPRTHRLKHVLQQGSRAPFSPVALSHKDLALLQLTGGTTGIAKHAMLTHGNMVSNTCQAHAWIYPYFGDAPQCIITALPLYHIFALSANCLTFLKLGAKNVLIVNPRDIPGFIKTMSQQHFTAITGVNTLFNALMKDPDFAKLDFSGLRCSLGGGMAVQEVVAKRWLEITGRPLVQAYGLTETSPAVTINPLDKKEFTGSIGLPVPSTEISLRNNAGEELAQGESGEICVRGPQVMPGYWNNPEETSKVFEPDGFFRTGDIGYVDEQGYLFIRDRKKDTILVSGFNVYPNEVEAIAMEHPDVHEVAAVGVPDEHSGEVVKLFVIRKNNTVTEEELIKHCRSKLTGYKAPKFVEFREDFPRSNVGKILRRELKN